MKYITAMIMALGLAALAQASDLTQNALKTLLESSNDISLDGDVHSNETVVGIYNSAVSAGAKIENKCAVIKASNIAKCTLWITYSPMGETAIDYVVNLPGTSLESNNAYVSRGD